MENPMKWKTFAVALLALILSAVPLSAQTYLTTTTLSSAVTSISADTIVVASATTAVAGGYVYIDHEAMLIISVSGTSLRVARGQSGTGGATHASAATVIIFPLAALTGSLPAFGQADPPYGTCTPGNQRFLPIVNVVTGNVWLCRYIAAAAVSRTWASTNIVMQNGVSSLLLSLP